ncbi:MAG: DUF2948 family protein [Planktomarina sp.]|nr:DUF2948 family protein [Planktomarina sp.]|tara:strand:- start:1179 stop:1634 length:456 start_codon:yes stop_codon:yes gene_type:complete
MNESFEDVSYKPLRLVAFSVEDLKVISSITQDAVFPSTEMVLNSQQRRFAILLNRYHWETTKPENIERVQAVLAFEDVKNVQTQKINQTNSNLALYLLNISFKSEEDGMGTVELILAGGGAIRLHVEALEVTLRDVTQPYLAPSGQIPNHN